MGQLEVKLLPEVEGLDVSPQEARELWSFLDGSIMNVDTRHHLWKAWGLCPRHNWSYATMEIEQRGGLPFSTTILFEDLTGRAARLLQRTALLPWALVVGRLDAKASCYSCDHAARAQRAWAEDRRRAARANARCRSWPLLNKSKEQWSRRTCPACLGGSGPICRLHLLAGFAPEDREVLAQQVGDLARRLRRFTNSMTWDGPAATPDEESSWVEALSWFGGWGLTVSILSAGIDPARCSKASGKTG